MTQKLLKLRFRRSDDVGASPRAATLRRWARAALDGIGESGSLCIRLVGEAEMTDLNVRYRHKQGTTNVLSFAVDMVAPDGGERLLGDVVICAPVVTTEASLQGKAEDGSLRAPGRTRRAASVRFRSRNRRARPR